MKVYVIIKKWDNEGTYEESYSGTNYIGVYSTFEEAVDMARLLSTTISVLVKWKQKILAMI